MQFYKYEGSTAAEEWTEENDNRRVMRQRARKIAMKTNGFNLQQENKACLFVSNVSEGTVTIGVIVQNCAAVEELVFSFLQTIETELTDACLEEITFNTLHNMLNCADRYDYIIDEEEILEQFDLDKLSGRFGQGIDYGEAVFTCGSKKSVYNDAGKFLAKASRYTDYSNGYGQGLPRTRKAPFNSSFL